MEKADTEEFFAGAIQFDARLSTDYRVGRALSADAADVWCAVLEPILTPLGRPTVLDLGCGTGRFSIVIGRRFRTRVIGVEPSWAMLRTAAADDPPPNVSYAGGRAERLPLGDGSCDVGWLSHVIHHVADPQACARELRRVLRPEGSVLIRGTFGDRTDGFPILFRFFPGAQRVAARFPTLGRVIAAFGDAGFVPETLRRIQQKTCDGLRQLADRTRLRADSTLALLSDAEFRRCQSTLEHAAQREAEPVPVVETLDFLVLRRMRRA
jgi:ubiquinone/menaquinone biosynthesis C-methylase UbiE